MANAEVVIRIVGSEAIKDLEGVRRKIKGVSDAEKLAARETAKSAKQAADAQKKAAADAERAAKKAAHEAARANTAAAREMARVARQTADAEKREADRMARYWEQAARKSADARIREEQRTMRTRQRDADRTLRRAGGLVGGAAAGVLAGGVSAAGVARGVAGVDDAATRVQKANDFRETLIVLGGNAGKSEADIRGLQDRITATGLKYGKDPTEIVQGLAAGHERFNMLDAFAQNIDEITKAAKASQGTVPEFIGMVGSVVSAFGLASEEIPNALNIMLAAARAGAVNPADFAASFSASAGIFATNTKQTGIEGLRQFVGASQGVAAGQFGAAESATRVERFVTDLTDKKVIADLKARGVQVIDPKTGKIDIGSVVDQIATNKRLQTSTQRQDVFKEIRALQGLDTLLAQRQKVINGQAGAVDFRTMAGVDAAEGAKGTDKILSMLESSGTLDMQRLAIEMQNDTIKNLRSYNEQIVKVTEATNALEKSFGTLGLWASSIGIGGAVGGGALALGKLGGGAAGGAAATAAGGGLLATLGTSVTAASVAALGATALGGAALGGALGYGANKITEAATGKSLSDRFADWLSSDVLEKRNSITKPEVDMHVQVDVKDNRVNVKTTSKARGAQVSTAAGPAMGGAM